MNPSYKTSVGSVDNNIPIIEGKKRVLHNLEGFAKPVEMLCIMGASGSGKTSFLNVLG